MAWIKRNLSLVIMGVVALLLLGVGLFYFFGSHSRNSEIEAQLEESLAALTNLYKAEPFPHETNVTTARTYAKQVRDRNLVLAKLFIPTPAENVRGLAFRTVLDKTLAELYRAAEAAHVPLPRTNYAFSFDLVRHSARFDPGSFPLMPQQLADIKAICSILFQAGVRPLAGVRRARVSSDDLAASSDYHDLRVETNAATGCVLSPYEFEFHCLSEGLAAVLDKLAKSEHCFIVRNLRVEPADEKAEPGQAGAAPALLPDSATAVATIITNRMGRRMIVRPPGSGAPGARPPGARSPEPGPAGVDKLITPLKEKRLRVNAVVVAVRPVK